MVFVTSYPGRLEGGQATGALIPVRCATTAALTLATDFEVGDTIDGCVLALNERVLNKNAVAQEENGPWVVQASGPPVRPTDFDTSIEAQAAITVSVSEGTANGNSQWMLTTDAPIVLGTTALVFTKGVTPALHAATHKPQTGSDPLSAGAATE